ncbi:MAG: hypothetical protein U1F43_00775 [Myxococcota bacterium]
MTLSLRFVGEAPMAVTVRVLQGARAASEARIAAGQAVELPVAPGPALVETRFPSGEVRREDVVVDAAGSELLIGRPSSPHEWLAWDSYVHAVADDDGDATTRARRPESVALAAPDQKVKWSLRAHAPEAAKIDLDASAELVDLRVDATRAAWLAVAPGEWRNLGAGSHERAPIDLLLTDAGSGEPRPSVCVRDGVLGALGFVRAGDVRSARLSQAEVENAAESALYNKARNPCLAAAAGYFLLRLRHLHPFDAWVENLMDWFPWLPDGAVLAAWKSWLVDGDVGAASDRLHLAAARGLPLYRTGLELLVDGLAALDPKSPALAAWRRVRRFVVADQVFTTLRLPRTLASEAAAAGDVAGDVSALPAGRPFLGRTPGAIVAATPPPELQIELQLAVSPE